MNPILVPVDFSDSTNIQLAYAAWLAKKMNTNMVLLHIFEDDVMPEQLRQVLKQSVFFRAKQSELNELAQKTSSEYGIEVFSDLREGNIFEIGNISHELSASAVVLLTHGTQGVQHISGSFAAKVLSRTNVPVFIVQDDAGKPEFSKVAFAPEYMENDNEKYNWIIKFSQSTGSDLIRIRSTSGTYTSDASTANLKRLTEEAGIDFADDNLDSSPSDFFRKLCDKLNNNGSLLVAHKSMSPAEKDTLSQDALYLLNNDQKVPVCFI